VRTALRAGRVCVPGSRRHQDPASYLLPDERWQTIRAELARTSRQPVDIAERLQRLADEQARLVKRLETAADSEAEAVLRDGELIADEAGDQRAGDGKLGKLVAERLPEISLPDLLIEVDGWTGFTERLTPAGAAASRPLDPPCVLYAAILAEATNLRLTGMARSCQYTLRAARMGHRLVPARGQAP
jgi:hypothetical protein